MSRNIRIDETHEYQPSTFHDLGEDRHSPHGYSWKRGNVLLEASKKDLLELVPRYQGDNQGLKVAADDLRHSIEAEAFWRIFKDLDLPINEERDMGPSEFYADVIGGGYFDHDLNGVISFTVNSALYTSKRCGSPGYWKGHTTLLRELKNPGSIAYNLNGMRGFRSRIVNGALWENLASNSGNDVLETILTQEFASINPSFSDAGRNILKINGHIDLVPSVGIDLSGLSKGAMYNLAYFIGEVKRDDVFRRSEESFQKILVKSFIEASEGVDHFEIPYFEGEEKESLQALVAA